MLYSEGRLTWFRAERISNPNSHGTGCTLSSAIACGLAEDLSLTESIRRAKAYLGEALRGRPVPGSGKRAAGSWSGQESSWL